MTATTLHDCSQLVTATLEAGGQVPKILTDIIGGAHLFNTRPVPVDPAHVIVKEAAAGTLTAERLDELLVTAASAQQVASFTGDVRQRSERLFVQEFHQALKAGGACDELLDTLRPAWDAHAEAVATARSEINSESSVEHILSTGSPKLVECWQQLPTHLSALDKIAAVARSFGPRIGSFPMIREYANSDGYLLEDSAIWCADGNLEADSAAFRRPSPQPRQHPLFAVVLKLHSVSSARERYRAWASQQWEQQHDGRPMQSWVDEEGKAHEFPRPTNPFAEAAQ